jgi:hypothetical protein
VACRVRSRVLVPKTLASLNQFSRSHSTTFTSPIVSASRSWRASHSRYSKVHQLVWLRGARRKVVIDLDNLPQGAIEDGFDELPPQDDEASDYPPLLQQVHNNMLKFSHCVVITRVGGFYEVCGNLCWQSSLTSMSSCTLNTPTCTLHY